MKKDWGSSIDYITILSEETDDVRGTRTIKKKMTSIECIKLPESQVRKFIQDIGYLAANKNFTYGALNDFNTISFIIDGNDIEDDFTFDLNGYIIHKNKRYERVSIDDVFEQAWLLICKGSEGSLPYSITNVDATNMLQMQGSVSSELN